MIGRDYQMMRTWRRIGLIAPLMLSGLLMSGCSEGSLFSRSAKVSPADRSPPAASTTSGLYKVGKPYQVQGVWYYPREDFDYDETGIASWYGPDFHGKLTANGEQFDQMAVTAAHKTLPMPSLVRVTNLENGRTLVVRINDRGPYVNGRIIDLSRRSAQLLGIEGKGTARVRVQILADESRALAGRLKEDAPGTQPPIAAAPRPSVTAESLPGAASASPKAAAAPAPRLDPAQAAEREIGQVSEVPVHATNIFVQAGSFSRYDNAARLSAQLSSLGNAGIQQAYVKGQTVYRVRLGPLASVEDADRLLDRVIGGGHPDARVLVE